MDLKGEVRMNKGVGLQAEGRQDQGVGAGKAGYKMRAGETRADETRGSSFSCFNSSALL